MSATKAREAAAVGDFKRFLGATGWEYKVSKQLYKDVRKFMGIEK